MEFLFEKLLNDNIQNEDYLSSLKICEKIINKYKDKYELILKNTQFYFSVYLLHLHQMRLQARNLRPS